jgi:hypothetical protein
MTRSKPELMGRRKKVMLNPNKKRFKSTKAKVEITTQQIEMVN